MKVFVIIFRFQVGIVFTRIKKSNITESKINTKLYRITVTRNMYSFLHSINQYVTTLQLLHHTFPQSQKHQFNTFYNYKSHSGNFRDKTSTKNRNERHHKCIKKRNDHSYQVKVKCIHSRLPSGKINFATKHSFPYCKITESSTTTHDRFLTCSQRTVNISLRLNHITKCMTLFEIPKQ